MPLKIVLTGAPGTGKSTVISLLLKDGFFCMEEISREIIKEAEELGKKNYFLSEPIVFSQAILDKRIAQYQKSQHNNVDFCFFDRGIPDVTAYLNHVNCEFPEHFTQALETHIYDLVFVFPPWRAIYTNDNERFETYEESILIDQSIVDEYKKKHPKVIYVPFGTPKERASFILKECYAHKL